MRESQLKKALHYGDLEQVEQLKKEIEQLQLFEFHHVSGFQHPKIPIIVSNPEKFKIAIWGLIPFWIKDVASGLKFYNNTLNARCETIFEKNTFKQSAIHNRCLIVVDGFYEHHHVNNKTYPYFITLKNNEPMILAGLWNEWKAKENTDKMITFSIVTTKGNNLMTKIHNNPKLEEPRMPVILPYELSIRWLETDAKDKVGQEMLLNLCQPYDSEEMRAHTVRPIRGKSARGNVPQASEPFNYADLNDL